MSSLNQTLLNLGFDQSEIDLYQASLKNGPQTAEELSVLTALSKIKTLAALSALLEKGLMSSVDRDQNKYFSAEHPDRLVEYARLNAQSALIAIKEIEKEKAVLEAGMSDEKPTVRFFEGKEGLHQMINEYNQMKDKQAMLIYPIDSVIDIFTDQERVSQREKRLLLNIETESIITTGKNLLDSAPKSDRIYLDQNKFPISSDIEIFDNKVMIASMSYPLHGVIIESQEIANSMRTVFKLAQLGAKQNRIIEKE